MKIRSLILRELIDKLCDMEMYADDVVHGNVNEPILALRFAAFDIINYRLHSFDWQQPHYRDKELSIAMAVITRCWRIILYIVTNNFIPVNMPSLITQDLVHFEEELARFIAGRTSGP